MGGGERQKETPSKPDDVSECATAPVAPGYALSSFAALTRGSSVLHNACRKVTFIRPPGPLSATILVVPLLFVCLRSRFAGNRRDGLVLCRCHRMRLHCRTCGDCNRRGIALCRIMLADLVRRRTPLVGRTGLVLRIRRSVATRLVGGA